MSWMQVLRGENGAMDPRFAKAGKDGFGACSLKIKIIQWGLSHSLRVRYIDKKLVEETFRGYQIE